MQPPFANIFLVNGGYLWYTCPLRGDSMNEFFPIMLEVPGTRTRGAGISYWLSGFWLLPVLVIYMTWDIRDQHDWAIWVELGYHAFHFAASVVVFWKYLKDGIQILSYNLKKFLKTVGICVLLIIGIKFVLFCVAQLLGNQEMLLNVLLTLPTGDLELLYYPLDVVGFSPLFGTIYYALFAPVSISCLFYACSFAPMSGEHPKLAYLVAAGVLLIPRLILMFYNWEPGPELMMWLFQLPVHMVACGAYQHTDNIWAPIAVHSIYNLLASVLILCMMNIF